MVHFKILVVQVCLLRVRHMRASSAWQESVPLPVSIHITTAVLDRHRSIEIYEAYIELKFYTYVDL